MTPLQSKTIEIAESQLHVRERGGNNRGPEVERYLEHVGQLPGNAWCAAFVSWCVCEAATSLGITPKFRKSAGALRLLEKNAGSKIAHPVPGCIMVFDHGKGLGHVAIVKSSVFANGLLTIEGNTGPGPATKGKDRDGQGVYCRTDRRADDPTVAGYFIVE